jgi:transposase
MAIPDFQTLILPTSAWLRIVAESFNGPRLVSATARRYGISPSQLYTWRRVFRAERIGAEDLAPGFVPAMIIP